MSDYPFDSSIQTKLDWVEVSCIKNEFKNYYFADLQGVLESSNDFDSEDIAEEDASVEAELSLIISEFEKRIQNLQDSYPFEVDGDVGIQLKNTDLALLTSGQLAYIYCLYFSHITSSRIFIDSPTPINKDRDIMQLISTIALSGVLEYGHSVSFGFPRPDGSDFYPALEQVLARIGEGKLKTKQQVNSYLAHKKVKDAGIDVISWKCDPSDSYPGSKQIYFAQVASGNNWESKAVLDDIRAIQDEWMLEKIPSRITDAMCIPFDFEQDGDYDLEDCYAVKARTFGYILHRLRIPKYLDKGLKGIEENPELFVERAKDIHAILTYVESITKKLEEAA